MYGASGVFSMRRVVVKREQRSLQGKAASIILGRYGTFDRPYPRPMSYADLRCLYGNLNWERRTPRIFYTRSHNYMDDEIQTFLQANPTGNCNFA